MSSAYAAEQALLGSFLIDAEAFDLVGHMGLTADSFTSGEHRAIFRAVARLQAEGKQVDPVTVFSAVTADSVGLGYLSELAQSVPTTRNAETYASAVIEAHQRRSIAAAVGQATALLSEPINAADLRNQIAALFDAPAVGDQAHVRSLAELLPARIEHWDNLCSGRQQPGISTGLAGLDAVIHGLKPGHVIVVAARPGCGKSALALQLGLNAASLGHPFLFISMEMRAGELLDRAVANLGRAPMTALSSGFWGQSAAGAGERIAEGADEAARLPVWIYDRPALSLAEVRSQARLVKRRHGLEVLAIDYLQLMSPGAKHASRHHGIEEISRGVKALAKELECAVLLLSQLNRRAEERDEPSLIDLKESGAVEEDADVVVLLQPKSKTAHGDIEVIAKIAKNRHGQRGRVVLFFDGNTQKWSDAR